VNAKRSSKIALTPTSRDSKSDQHPSYCPEGHGINDAGAKPFILLYLIRQIGIERRRRVHESPDRIWGYALALK
jgi:hypothetical protein